MLEAVMSVRTAEYGTDLTALVEGSYAFRVSVERILAHAVISLFTSAHVASISCTPRALHIPVRSPPLASSLAFKSVFKSVMSFAEFTRVTTVEYPHVIRKEYATEVCVVAR